MPRRRPHKPSPAALDAARRAQPPDPDLAAAMDHRAAGAVIARQAGQRHLSSLAAHGHPELEVAVGALNAATAALVHFCGPDVAAEQLRRAAEPIAEDAAALREAKPAGRA